MTDLSNLPEISFLETDAVTIERDILATYETITGRTLSPGNPERLFCESMAYVIVLLRSLIDYSAKQNLLAYAGGDYLDHLGALLDVTRLEASAATCTVRFSLSEALGFVVAIPEGSRVTPGGQVYFRVTGTAEIAAGETYVDVAVEALDAGAAGNGYIAEQINAMVDVISYVATVSNLTMSIGGSDVETDDHFRTRIQGAPEKFSVAGPDGAYDYWARTAHQDVMDVSVVSPTPGVVEVRPLMAGGELPADEILTAVSETLNDRKRRPLTDQVIVDAPKVVSYRVELTYYLPNSKASLAASYQTAVNAAVDAFVLWQKSAMGRDVNPSALTARMVQAGAKRVEIVSPGFQVVDADQVAMAESVTVNYGGLEDE